MIKNQNSNVHLKYLKETHENGFEIISMSY